MDHHLRLDRGTVGEHPCLRLFGGLVISVDDRELAPPDGSKRLLALLALEGRSVGRCELAARLWPGADRRRAAGNLRTALWRLQGAGLDLICCHDDELMLKSGMAVDVEILREWAGGILGGTTRDEDLHLARWMEEGLCVLPGWYDDWVIIERERLRHRVLAALEQLSIRLRRHRRFAESVEAALVAVCADPLRESAQRVLIEAHLADGNLVEAHRADGAYRRLLCREFGSAGPSLISSLMAGFGCPRSA